MIDRDTASPAGHHPADMDNALYDAFGQRQVSTMYRPLNQYHVVMEVAPQFQQTPTRCKNIYLRSTTGRRCRSAPFTHYEPTNTPLSVNHQGQFPSVTISFNLAPGVSLGEATEAIEQAEREIGFPPDSRQLSGNRRGFSGFAVEPADADPRRAGRPSTSCWAFL